MSDDERVVYGTADLAGPISRADFERAVRSLNASDLDLRDAVLKLAAHVITLTDELTRRIDGVEPTPAPPITPAAPAEHTVEVMVAAHLSNTLDQIRARDVLASQRVSIDPSTDKYESKTASPPCEELLPICKARCCKLTFALSTQDLDEGVVRWDYGQPYLIRQRQSDGYCVHNHPDMHGCTVHQFRPRICRAYDCRKDDRIWTDYENKIPAPYIQHPTTRDAEHPPVNIEYFQLLDRVKARHSAVHFETSAVTETFSDAGPVIGPQPQPRKPLLP